MLPVAVARSPLTSFTDDVILWDQWADGHGCLAAGLVCCRGQWCAFHCVLHASSELHDRNENIKEIFLVKNTR